MEKISNEKRTEILEAAVKLFSERGFEKTTVDEIATKANVGKGTIYLYFQNKEDIFLGVLEEGMAKLLDIFEKIIQSGNFTQQLYDMIYSQFKFIEDNQEFYKIHLKEQVNLELKICDDADNSLAQLHRRLYELITNFIRKGIEEGYIRPGPPESYVAAIAGIVSHTAFHWLIRGGDSSLISKTDVVLNIFLNGVQNPNFKVSGGVSNVS